MQDIEKLKRAKQQCLSDLRDGLPRYADSLNAIDRRLMAYIEDAISNDASHANIYELLGIRKTLRLMDSYATDTKRVRMSLRVIEGEWKNGRHVKGGLKFDTPRGNQHVRLMPYQVWCVFGLYAFKTDVCMERPYIDGDELLPTEWVKDGIVWDTRRLTDEIHLFQTRKSGKTEFGAAIDFTEACFLGPANAQVLICAPSSELSKIAYKAIKEFAMQVDPTCINRMGGKYFKMTRDGLNWQPGHRMKGEIKTMAAGKMPKDGYHASVVHADEHGQPGYINGVCDMQSTVETCWGSTGPRREKLLMHTTTAGRVKEGPYKTEIIESIEPSLLRELDYPLGIPHRTDDDSWFAFLLRLDPWEVTDDITKLDDTELFRKVNRSIGITVQPDYYRKRLHEASQSDDTKKEVLTKDFNMWQGSTVVDWIKAEQMRTLQTDLRVDQCTALDGWVTFGGLDFSQGDDLHTAAWLSARRHPSGRGTQFHADCDCWIKQDTLERSPIRPLYEQWIKDGWLHVSEGKVFQPSLFITRLDEIMKKGVQFMYFGYDKYQSKDPINTLKAYFQSVMKIANPDPYIQVVSQLNSEFNAPTDDLYAAMFAPVPFITFSMSPLWPFCFGNAVLEIDNRGNKRPVKRSQSEACKIDPVQAIIMALDLYERYEGMNH